MEDIFELTTRASRARVSTPKTSSTLSPATLSRNTTASSLPGDCKNPQQERRKELDENLRQFLQLGQGKQGVEADDHSSSDSDDDDEEDDSTNKSVQSVPLVHLPSQGKTVSSTPTLSVMSQSLQKRF